MPTRRNKWYYIFIYLGFCQHHSYMGVMGIQMFET
jgi:hypothetical protein